MGGRSEAEGGVVVWPKTAGSLICRQDGSPCIDRGAQIVVRIAGNGCLNPSEAQSLRVYSEDGVSPTLSGEGGGAGAKTGLILQAAGFNGHRAAGAEIEFAEERAPGVTASMPPNVVAYPAAQNRSNPKPGDPGPTLCAEPKAPIIVAGFKAGQGADAGSIGYQEECAPTIGGAASGLNQVPAICIQGNCIDRADTAGCNGRGWRDDDRSCTLNTIDRPAVPCMATGQANAEILADQSPTLNCDHEQPIAVDARNLRATAEVGTLQSKDNGGQSLNYINPVMQHGIVRRLTPLECERLQGYPDGWTDIPEITDISDEGYETFKQLLFDAAVREGTIRKNPTTGAWERWSKKRYEVHRKGQFQYWATVWKNTRKPYQHKSKPQMLKYINSLNSDSARYKSLGNSIALPPWRWVCQRIAAQYDRPITLGSLFDGIGGFPRIWEEINGKGSAKWAGEIEPFCVAVTMLRFGGVERGSQ